ncbi:16S rRNA (adenine(1518)-N(6)/adenine(1519)-N(6))-dimethyltransferase RsmA [bacterium]|nr:16S rRNA (adenine(1518)-N(6)/adenine(1519)-N(6))-dimethyltransferase RsmA [bacterium]
MADDNYHRRSEGDRTASRAERDHRRALGQNFLKSESIARRIAESLGPLESSHVLELGAGPGRLSGQIVQRAAVVTLLELDPALVARLEEKYRADARVSVVRGDILRFDFGHWAGGCAPLTPVVAGNIPYNITSNLLHCLLEARSHLGTVVLMLQEEVARKLTCTPGGKAWAMLPVLINCYASSEYLFRVEAGNFSPQPKVDSAVVRLDFAFGRGGCPQRPQDERLFQALVKRLFLERRKQVQKVLRSDPLYRLGPEQLERLAAAVGQDLGRRPEELSVEDFIRLADCLATLRAVEPGPAD